MSTIIDPTGEVLCVSEGIAYAETDIAQCVKPRQAHDVVGYYNRFDVFQLSADRSPRDPTTIPDTNDSVPGNIATENEGDETDARGKGEADFN